jgi:small subunit ribosomal protein S4
MARHIDPVCRLCRREGMKLHLKGSRCDSPKCAIERRDGPPGMHMQRRGKQSEYSTRLREKQKLKRFYGVLERQFRRYFELASRSTENTGEVLLSILERRLDNVLYRFGWAHSRAGARQLASHGHILLNGRMANIPSMLLKAGDTISVKNRPGSIKLVRLNLESGSPKLPGYLEQTAAEPPTGKVLRLPARDDVDPNIQEIRENLIIEVSSR